MSSPDLHEIFSDDSDLALLRSLAPVAPAGADVLDDARVVLMRRIGSAPVVPQRRWASSLLVAGRRPDRDALPRPGPGRRWALAAAAAALVAGTVTAPSWLPLGTGSKPADSAEASTFLRSVAAVSQAQPGNWQDAAFWYTKTREDDGTASHVRQAWIGHRAAGRLTWDGRDDATLDGPAVFSVGGGTSTDWAGLWKLPTDPAALERALRAGRQGAGPDADSELLTSVGDLLRESPAPPALRAALYRVAANVPGVRLVRDAVDAVGRKGVAVVRGTGQGQQSYLIDPSDGRLLEEQTGAVRAPQVCGNPGSDPAPSATASSSEPETSSLPPATATPGPTGLDVTSEATPGPTTGGFDPGIDASGQPQACWTVYNRMTYLVQGPVATDHAVPAGH